MVKKTRLLGYGEDALTLWAVTERLDLILEELGDDSDPTDCTVFYRPSFGRRRFYGEFDAIIVAPKTAYLVESKWDKSKMPNNLLTLDDEQALRHEIIKWYHLNWRGGDWGKFAEENDSKFREGFPGKYIPSSKDGGEVPLLAQNLQKVLNYIRGRELKDILIFFHRGEIPKIETDFEVVKIEYEPTHGNYIELCFTKGAEV